MGGHPQPKPRTPSLHRTLAGPSVQKMEPQKRPQDRAETKSLVTVPCQARDQRMPPCGQSDSNGKNFEFAFHFLQHKSETKSIQLRLEMKSLKIMSLKGLSKLWETSVFKAKRFYFLNNFYKKYRSVGVTRSAGAWQGTGCKGDSVFAEDRGQFSRVGKGFESSTPLIGHSQGVPGKPIP